ncbi:MAG: competence/damage-inducible protein A [Planctomycetota bacterium]
MNTTTAYIFCIGRELLEGLVLDRNANFMAGKLSEAGIRVMGIQVLDDREDVMVSAFQHALEKAPRYILTTGGMGPGHDDITRECVAKATNVPLKTDDAALAMVATSYRRLFAKGMVDDAEVNEDRIKMARVPEGSVCFENPMGTAPAIKLAAGRTTFFMVPGQPQEMQRMFDLYVLPMIQSERPGTHRKAAHIDFPGRDESALSRVLADMSRRYPGLHSKARLQGQSGEGGIRITIFGEHADPGELDEMLQQAEADMRARLGLEVQSHSTTEGTAEE